MRSTWWSERGDTLDATRDGDACPPSSLDRETARGPETADRTPLIRLDNISRRFTTGSGCITALDHVSLTIAANEFFTLLGPSGCGKTTLLRLVAGFEHPDTGILLLDGKDVAHEPPNERPVNIVFQSYALFPHMSVGRNVGFGLERQGWPRPKIKSRVDAMLQLVRLDDMAQRNPSQLSGGQQQRVALARALAPNPKVLLLDEPLSALDLKLRRGMQVELKRIQRETGITFLLVTHDQEEALSMSDRIAVMDAGHIVQIGRPNEIYETPASRFVADFMGANVLPGSLLDIEAAHVAIRPEHIGFATDSSGLPGRVRETTYLGATTLCVVALDAGTTVHVESKDVPAFAVGEAVRCIFPRDALASLSD